MPGVLGQTGIEAAELVKEAAVTVGADLPSSEDPLERVFLLPCRSIRKGSSDLEDASMMLPARIPLSTGIMIAACSGVIIHAPRRFCAIADIFIFFQNC